MKRWGPWKSSFSLSSLMMLFSSSVLASNPQQAAGLDVVASGLDSPRGLTFGPDGALYITEAGVGGEGPCIPGPDGSEACFGASGAVTRVLNDQQERIVTGLPSFGSESGEVAGPHDVSVRGDDIFVVLGLGADPAVRVEAGLPDPGDNSGQIVRLLDTGGWETVVDIAAYETAENPDGGALDSNPYGLLALDDGFIVADAGGNDLLRVDASNDVSTLAVFADSLADAPPFLGLDPGAQIPMQAVPTTVTIGPDGAYYVGQLNGFPFAVGAANVFRVVEGEDSTVFADGFTNIVDIAFDDDENLWVLEIAANSLLAEAPAGALTRVSPDGTREIMVSEGLTMPTGVAVGPDGNVYISNCGVCAGVGEVLRLAIPMLIEEPETPSVGDFTFTPLMGAMAGLLGLSLVVGGGLVLRYRRRLYNA